MLPTSDIQKRDSSIGSKIGKMVRNLIEVMFFMRLFRFRKNRKRNRISKKKEALKGFIFWFLVVFMIRFLFTKSDVTVLEEEYSPEEITNTSFQNDNKMINNLELEEKDKKSDFKDTSLEKETKNLFDENLEKETPKNRQKNVFNTILYQTKKKNIKEIEKNIKIKKRELEDTKKSLGELENIKKNFKRSEKVKDAILHSIKGYLRHAMEHDEVYPLTNETNDSWGGFGITLIDSVDTLCICSEENQEFEDLLLQSERLIKKINFKKDVKVSVFETTIRILGGLIASFECTGMNTYLEKAIEIGDLLLYAFDSPSGLPYHELDLKAMKGKNPSWTRGKSILSEVGSVQLEFFALSLYSGDPKYKTISSRSIDSILENKVEYPGLYPVYLDINTGNFSKTSNMITVGGLADSFYEYLLKLYLLTGEKYFIDLYDTSIQAIKKNLVRRAKDRTWLINLQDGRKENLFEHLTCFFPGLLYLGHMTLPGGRKDDLDLADELLETCIELYASSPTGISPDEVEFNPKDGTYTIEDKKSLLRPETVESLYYKYKLTKDPKYQDIAWSIFQSFEIYAKTNTAFSGLTDVTKGTKNNSMQSFFIAETLKYLFLIFEESSLSNERIDLENFVFSTEAHIFRRFDK